MLNGHGLWAAILSVSDSQERLLQSSSNVPVWRTEDVELDLCSITSYRQFSARVNPDVRKIKTHIE